MKALRAGMKPRIAVRVIGPQLLAAIGMGARLGAGIFLRMRVLAGAVETLKLLREPGALTELAARMRRLSELGLGNFVALGHAHFLVERAFFHANRLNPMFGHAIVFP